MPYTKDFSKLLKNLDMEYLGAPVPKKYQERYGKRYDKKDVKSFAYAVAYSKGIKVHKGKK